MDKEGIRSLLESKLRVLPDSVTDNNDRQVWISDVADVFHEIANTKPDDDEKKVFKAGGRYLVTQIEKSQYTFSHGMKEVECLKVTENAYLIKIGETTYWIKKNWSKEILEILEHGK